MFCVIFEEIVNVFLLLYVIDSSVEESDVNVVVVNEVLEEIGVDIVLVLYVYNKVDVLEDVLLYLECDE